MTEHPQELLADLVDGRLSGEDLARVESHLSTCDRCTEEVALARSAVEALAAMPEEVAPFGVARAALREAAGGPKWWQGRTAWRFAGAAAAAAAVVGAVVFVSLRPVDQADSDGPAFLRAPAEDAAAPSPTGELTLQGEENAAVGVESEPTFSRTSQDLDPDRLTERTARIVADASSALDQGYAPTAEAFYSSYDLRSLEPAAQRALSCATEGAPDRTVVPFHIEETAFQGEPVYLVAFLAGPAADQPYDRVQVLVAERETCAIRHFARQNL